MIINSNDDSHGKLYINSVDDLCALREFSVKNVDIIFKQVLLNKNRAEFLNFLQNTKDMIRLADAYPQQKEQIFSALLEAPSKDFLRIIGKNDSYRKVFLRISEINGFETFEQAYPEMKEDILARLRKNPDEYHYIFSSVFSNKSSFFKHPPSFTEVDGKILNKFNKKLQQHYPQHKEKLAYKDKEEDFAIFGRRHSVS